MATHRRVSDLFGAAADAAVAASRSLGTGPAAAVLFWGSPPETEVVHRDGVPDAVSRALAAAGGRHLAEVVHRQGRPVWIHVSDLPLEADGLAAALRSHDLSALVVLPLYGEHGVLGYLVLGREEEAFTPPEDGRWREASRMLSAVQIAAGAASLRLALGEEGAPPLVFDGVVVMDRWERLLFADGLVLEGAGWDGPNPFGRSLGQLPGGSILSKLKPGLPGQLVWAQHLFPPLEGSGIPVELASLPAGVDLEGDTGSRIVLVRDLRADKPAGADPDARLAALALRLAHGAAELAEAWPVELGQRDASVVPRPFLEAARTVPMLVRAVLERVLGREGMARSDLNQATSETLYRLREELEAARVKVFSFLRPELGVVPADVLGLRHVLRTLMGKARRSLRAGGTLTARTWSEGGFACLAVSDDGAGVGLGKAVVDADFQPLFADEQDGLDGELDAVKVSVEGWGGRFLVEQRPGVWNRYTLMLPESGDAVRPTLRAASTVDGAEDGDAVLKVLVVDDNAALRSVVKRFLERRGHEVTEAVDGDQALGLCGGHAFDRLIVDVCMPNKTGPEFYVGLESVAPALQARTFFMTGGGLESHDERFVLESGRPAIMKPFDLSELARTVEAGA